MEIRTMKEEDQNLITQFIKQNIVQWIREAQPAAATLDINTKDFLTTRVIDLTERMARVEEAIKHQGILLEKMLMQMDKRFESNDKRFEQVDKRFDQVDKRINRLTALLTTTFVTLIGGFITIIVQMAG